MHYVHVLDLSQLNDFAHKQIHICINTLTRECTKRDRGPLQLVVSVKSRLPESRFYNI